MLPSVDLFSTSFLLLVASNSSKSPSASLGAGNVLRSSKTTKSSSSSCSSGKRMLSELGFDSSEPRCDRFIDGRSALEWRDEGSSGIPARAMAAPTGSEDMVCRSCSPRSPSLQQKSQVYVCESVGNGFYVRALPITGKGGTTLLKRGGQDCLRWGARRCYVV